LGDSRVERRSAHSVAQAKIRGCGFALYYLGQADGNRIRVSANAAGNSWFIDTSSNSESIFAKNASATRRYTDPASNAAGRIDLLTTIMHEMGHAIGLPDTYDEKDRDKVMYGFLTKGERRVPAKGEAIGAVPGKRHRKPFPGLGAYDRYLAEGQVGCCYVYGPDPTDETRRLFPTRGQSQAQPQASRMS